MGVSYEAEWGFDNPNSRERFTQAPRGQTEQFNFRAYSNNLRVLDEIIHSGIDPRLKTKSDCLQDALALWIQDWTQNYSDGLGGRTLQMLKLEYLRNIRESRDRFLERTDEEWEAASKAGDIDALTMIHSGVRQEREDSLGYAGQAYIKELDSRIRVMDETLRKETPQ